MDIIEARDDLSDGTLVRVLKDFPAPTVAFSLVDPPRRHSCRVGDRLHLLQQAPAELATANINAPRKQRANTLAHAIAFITPQAYLIGEHHTGKARRC
jgi:hypothetical protein